MIKCCGHYLFLPVIYCTYYSRGATNQRQHLLHSAWVGESFVKTNALKSQLNGLTYIRMKHWIITLWNRAETNFKLLAEALLYYLNNMVLLICFLTFFCKWLHKSLDLCALGQCQTFARHFSGNTTAHCSSRSQGWCLFHSALPEVLLLFKGGH